MRNVFIDRVMATRKNETSVALKFEKKCRTRGKLKKSRRTKVDAEPTGLYSCDVGVRIEQCVKRKRRIVTTSTKASILGCLVCLFSRE
jgi:hypothetical protein